MDYLVLVAGFILLIKGADYFVEGSSSVAKRLRVPSLIIGLTIVALGTSLPECSVSVSAALADANELAISNVVGSNIFNLMVVCGLCAVFCPLAVQPSTLKREFPLSVLAAFLLMLLGGTGMLVGHMEGVLLLLFFLAFIIWMIQSARKARMETVQEEYDVLPVGRCILYIVGGIVAIALGGDFVVDSASSIAASFGLSQNLIGLTVVAFGTSLPELVTSIVAARKNEVDMALGNVIGSNIFNILFILGIAAAIAPIGFIEENMIDLIILVLVSLLVWLFGWTKKKIVRWEGLVMVGVYAGYLIYICQR